MVILFVIIVLVVVIMASESSNKKKHEEEYQQVKSDVAHAFVEIGRTLEALDILEKVLKIHDKSLHFYRYIEASPPKHFLFDIQYIIIKSYRNPFVQEALDSILREKRLRATAKDSGETLPQRRTPDNYTVWCDFTDEQVELLYDMITDLDEHRDEDNDIVLEGLLPLPCDGYIYQVKMKTKALAEAIHEKFPEYGLEVKYYGGNATGIHFNDKSGVVSYENI